MATREMPTLRDPRLTLARALETLDNEPCRVEGCLSTTSEHKPYCLDHLDRLPFVRKIRAELSRRDAEEAAASNPRLRCSLDPSGTRAREILEELGRRGTQTLERLAQTLRIPVQAVVGYVEALEGADLVRTIRVGSRRGGFRRVVALVPLRSTLRTAS